MTTTQGFVNGADFIRSLPPLPEIGDDAPIPTWELLVEHEPALAALEREAAKFADIDDGWFASHPGANDGIVHRLEQLVGWCRPLATAPAWMYADDAYDVAVQRLRRERSV